jgi:ferrous iron transport protein B
MNEKTYNFLLIGNPNVGKSTFFSQVTGENAHIANRPGVTIERQSAFFTEKGFWQVEDLPGIYYLDSECHYQALDQQVTLLRLNALRKNDILVNIIDCRLLRRNLYLTLQLIELKQPMVLILNFNEDPSLSALLAKKLKIAVLTWDQALNYTSLESIFHQENLIPSINHFPLNATLTAHELRLSTLAHKTLLDWDLLRQKPLEAYLQSLLKKTNLPDIETALATIRYNSIDALALDKKQETIDVLSEKIDHFTMNRYLGIPLFLLIMYTTFWTTIVLGGSLTPFIEATVSIPFIYVSQFINNQYLFLIISSMGIGLQTLASFVAPLFILYMMLGILEQTGYMQRAALVIDKLMQYLKLPGQSFVPIIVGFGCNVPAIMSSRTLDYERDRIQSILMSPFMSCSARLAIFTVFANSFFGTQGYQIIFGLYLFGFMIAILTGLVVRYSMGLTQTSPLIQEIVSYRMPNIQGLIKASWIRIRIFLTKAATAILPATLIIHTLVHSGLSLNLDAQQKIVKVFQPIGLEARDWPAALSLVSGLVAKEVVIGTLEAFTLPKVQLVTQKSFFETAYDQLASAFAETGSLSFFPWTTSDSSTNNTALEGLFANQHAAVSYLIFVLLYFPCISVTTAIARESRSFWAAFSVIWSTSLAYISAMLYYQFCTKNLSTLILMQITMGCLLYLLLLIFLLKQKVKADKRTRVPFVIKGSLA